MELGQAAAYEDMVREKEQKAALTQAALLEWHLISKQKDASNIREFSSTSGISVSTTQTQTSCAMDEDYPPVVPPSIQSTSLEEEESRMQLRLSKGELQPLMKEQPQNASRTSKREKERSSCHGVLSAGESNSSFASQSSEPFHNHNHNRLPQASLAFQVMKDHSHSPSDTHQDENLMCTPRGGEEPGIKSQDVYRAAANSNLVGKLNMNVMKEAAIASLQISEDVGQARSSTCASSHYEAIDVVKAMADLALQCKASMRDVFNHFDRDKDGVLDREDLLMMIRQLLPSLSVQERCYLIENLIAFNPSGGQISYPDVKRICILLGAQTSPNGSHVIRGWPSAVHTSVATIHSSSFSAFASSNISSHSQSSFENERWSAQKHAQWQPDTDGRSIDEDHLCMPPEKEQGHKSGDTPLTKARRRSSLMLGDALVNFQDDAMNSQVSPATNAPINARRTTFTDDSAIPEENQPQRSVQTFLGSKTSQMKLMARGELPATLKEVFQKIYADGSDFLHSNSVSETSMDVSKWCKSFVHGGYIRVIKLATKHPRLGTLQTLDTQRMVWGKDKRTLIVENRTMTPDFPNGLQWRVERRCAYVQVSPGIVLLTITAGVHVIHYFLKANQLQKAVERTLPEDARSHFQAIYNTIMITK